jgi:von Willebrand factor type A domain-containing protein
MLAPRNEILSAKPRHPRARSGFYRLWLSVVALAGLGLAANCGGGDDDDGNNGGPDNGSSPCDTVYKGLCGSSCNDAAPCPQGLFCGNGVCTAQCSADGGGCSGGQVCTASGRCVSDVGGGGSGGTGGGFGVSGSGGGGRGGQGGDCPGVTVQFSPIVPTIVVLVDQSKSMTDSPLDPDDDNSPNRWDALKDALLADNGVLKSLQSKVRFGLVTYSWSGEKADTCPQTPITVAPKLNNYDAISSQYGPADTIDNTPSAESVAKVHNDVLKPFAEPGPKFLILATDGDPDDCSNPNSNGSDPPKQASVAAVTAAYGDDITTYVIGVSENSVDRNHLRQLALAGQGKPTDGTEELFFEVGTQAQLTTALSSIVTGARSCSFDLDATITEEAAPKGAVTVDGQPKTFKDPNGWKLADNDTIEFVGTACEQIKAGAMNVSAEFPCGTTGVIPIPR